MTVWGVVTWGGATALGIIVAWIGTRFARPLFDRAFDRSVAGVAGSIHRWGDRQKAIQEAHIAHLVSDYRNLLSYCSPNIVFIIGLMIFLALLSVYIIYAQDQISALTRIGDPIELADLFTSCVSSRMCPYPSFPGKFILLLVAALFNFYFTMRFVVRLYLFIDTLKLITRDKKKAD
jgi:hypothetical protein